MAATVRQQFLLRGMGERQVAKVVAEGGHAQDPPPVLVAHIVGELVQQVAHPVSQVLLTRHHIEHPGRQFHDPEGVLEAPVRRTGIHQVAQGELVDVP